MSDIVNLYLIVGGMPEAVAAYRQTKSLEDVTMIHSEIVKQYNIDFTKYEEENRKLMLVDTYDLVHLN